MKVEYYFDILVLFGNDIVLEMNKITFMKKTKQYFFENYFNFLTITILSERIKNINF